MVEMFVMSNTKYTERTLKKTVVPKRNLSAVYKTFQKSISAGQKTKQRNLKCSTMYNSSVSKS